MTKECVHAHDTIAHEYDTMYDTPYFRFLNEMMEYTVLKHVPASGAILDAAGGTGDMSLTLAKKGFAVTCSDLSEKMLGVARQKTKEHSISLVQSDVTNMHEFSENQFDMTLCLGNVLSYCNYEKALDEIKRVTKPGCHIIVDMHSLYQEVRNMIASDNFPLLKQILKTHQGHDGNFMKHYFTIPEIYSLFEKKDIEIVALFGKQVLPNCATVTAMDTVLANKAVYTHMLAHEKEIYQQEQHIKSALEIGVIGKIR